MDNKKEGNAKYYTDEVNTLILVSLLKEHGIKRIIASPGTTNISFVGSVQHDPFFKVFSVVDERAAGFMACGLAEESGEPVVLSCTGATASRNYIPGLTEAYYRHLPVLAVTSSQHTGKAGNYVAQMIDRSSSFPDMIKKSIELPTIHSEEDKQSAITKVNEIILELFHHECGPCHINLCTTYSNNFTVSELPKYRAIHRIKDNDFPEIPNGRIAVFCGAHQEFSKEETYAIDSFCRANGAIVICDQVSNYRGEFRFLANLVNSQEINLGLKSFDLIIYIGYIHGAYIPFKGKQLWRVNPDGIIRDPYRNLTYVFEMSESEFFLHYSGVNKENPLLELSKELTSGLLKDIPDIPFSNMWVAKETAYLIPKNSVLHLAILNTLRVWNYFETDSSVLCFSNTGGYGIDGCLSSFLGAAATDLEKEHFLVIGDLSFFYDINSLFNNLPNNIHIMLINNGVGTEFKNYSHRASYFGDEADWFIAAKGHNGFKNPKLIHSLCAELDVQYLSATNKEEYIRSRDYWLMPGNGPILFEVFTNDEDESKALKLMNTIAKDTSVKSRIRGSALWKAARNLIKRGS